MKDFLHALGVSIEHLKELDNVFLTYEYPEKKEYLKNQKIISELNNKLSKKFTDELYFGDHGRQMILNDLFEYIFNARGYYYMWNPKNLETKNNFVKIILRFINQLMILESISVNHDLRNKVLDSLKEKLGEKDFFLNNTSINRFNALKKFKGDVHFNTNKKNIVPEQIIEEFNLKDNKNALKEFDKYTDSLLPKLPHGLWRELIVYIQLLRINAGYILPLLLNQRIISKNNFLKPPDFLVIRDNSELVGVEVGGGKETQSSNFSGEMKCQMVTAQNTNIPPRCPICGKWILFCHKVIEEYSDLDDPLMYIYEDIRCAYDCDKFSYEEVLEGKCPYVKYKGIIDEERNPKQEIKFSSNYHYHYSCILKSGDETALKEIKRQKDRWEKHLQSRGGKIEDSARQMRINCLKTNYPYFEGLKKLENYNKSNLKCYGKYLKNRNCRYCDFSKDCEKLFKITEIINSSTLTNKNKTTDLIKKLFPN